MQILRDKPMKNWKAHSCRRPSRRFNPSKQGNRYTEGKMSPEREDLVEKRSKDRVTSERGLCEYQPQGPETKRRDWRRILPGRGHRTAPETHGGPGIILFLSVIFYSFFICSIFWESSLNLIPALQWIFKIFTIWIYRISVLLLSCSSLFIVLLML